MLKLLFSTLLIFNVLLTNSQTNKYFDDIKKSFENKTQVDLTKISEALKRAQKDFDAGQKFYTSKEISKSLASYKKSSGIFAENYRNLFTIYENKLNGLIKESEGNKKNYFEKKMQHAKNYFSSSIYNRLASKKEKDENAAVNFLKESHKDEMIAIDDLSEIFALINGWETSDYVVKKTDYTLNQVFENKNTAEYQERSFAVNDPELVNGFKFNNQITENGGSKMNRVNNNIGNSDITVSNSSGFSKSSEFKLQIGTSILPANDSQIKRLNKTNLPVNTYKSKVYYKYTIGSFSSFQEAKNYKNAYGLSNTYIVEYNNGKQVKLYMKDYR